MLLYKEISISEWRKVDMKKRSAALLAALVMAGSLVGCGALSVGGSDSGTKATEAPAAGGESQAQGGEAASRR